MTEITLIQGACIDTIELEEFSLNAILDELNLSFGMDISKYMEPAEVK